MRPETPETPETPDHPRSSDPCTECGRPLRDHSLAPCSPQAAHDRGEAAKRRRAWVKRRRHAKSLAARNI